MAAKHGVPSIDLSALRLQLSDLAVLPQEVARRHAVLPVLVKDNALFLAMSAPDDQRAIEEVEFVSGMKVLAFGCDSEQLSHTIDTAYERLALGEAHWAGPRSSPPSAPKPPALPPLPPSGTTAPLPKTLKSRSATIVQSPGVPQESPRIAPRVPLPGSPSTPIFRSDPPISPSMLPSSLPQMLSPSGHSVLLIVGHDADRELLRESFADLGHTVSEHPRIEGAVEIIEARRPDLVVVEAQLPDGHGFTLLEALRGRPVSALVLLSGASTRRTLDDLRTSFGVKGVLERPIRAVDVLTRAEAVFEKTPEPDAPEDYLSPQAEVSLQSGVEAYQRGELDQAIRFVEEGLQSAPTSYRLHYHHGLLLGRRGDVHAACAALERSLALHDHYFPALRNLAVLYERAGFRRGALDLWERAHAASPDDASRESIKARIVSLL